MFRKQHRPVMPTARRKAALLHITALFFCLLSTLQAAEYADEVKEVSDPGPPGFKRATTDKDMEPLYRDNLEADLVPWQAAVKARGSKYTVADLLTQVLALLKGRPKKYLSLIVVKGGDVHVSYMAQAPMKLTISRTNAIRAGLINATQAGLKLPDSVYLMNVWDEAWCYSYADGTSGSHPGSHGGLRTGLNVTGGPSLRRQLGPPCTVPVFSLIKRWDYDRQTSNEVDVLHPFFNHVYGNLLYYPYEKKTNKALMRAALQLQMGPSSTRLHIIKLQKNDPEGKRLLDAGITNNLKPSYKIQLSDYVQIRDHARWRYLLSADGFTASCRLGKLLGTNSVVVKETTPWIEYYYRSLKPGEHFEPFTKDNVLQVIQALEGDRKRYDRVVDSAQRFAYTYLSTHNKAMYVRQALRSYNALFEDMGELMAQLEVGSSEHRGGTLPLMELLLHIKKFAMSKNPSLSLEIDGVRW